MPREDIDSLRLGAAYRWYSSSPELDFTEEKAMSYSVIGLPDQMTAMIHRVRVGRWYFVVHGHAQEDFEEKEPTDDKDAALEGLKGWLRTTVLTQ